MKQLFALFSVVLILSSCGIMQDGFSNHGIQKRKYTSGFYLKKRGHFGRSSNADQVREDDQQNAEVSNSKPFEDVENENLNSQQTIQGNGDQHGTKPANEQEVNRQESKKKTSVNKNTPVPVKKRRERVPEKYMPIQQQEVVKVPLKKHNAASKGDDMFILAVILAIFIPPLGVAVYTNIDWKKVLICLILTLLLFLPGMIYALLVVFDVI